MISTAEVPLGRCPPVEARGDRDDGGDDRESCQRDASKTQHRRGSEPGRPPERPVLARRPCPLGRRRLEAEPSDVAAPILPGLRSKDGDALDDPRWTSGAVPRLRADAPAARGCAARGHCGALPERSVHERPGRRPVRGSLCCLLPRRPLRRRRQWARRVATWAPRRPGSSPATRSSFRPRPSSRRSRRSRQAGGVPVVVDVSDDDYCIDPAAPRRPSARARTR